MMEQMQNINPDRIRWCCKDYGIAPEELAHDLKISAQTLTDVLRGQGGVTFRQLQNIAHFFNRGVLFFLDEGPVQEKRIRTRQFRSIANQKPDLMPEIKALIERVEKHREIFLSLCDELGEPVPDFDPPDVPRDNPRQAATIVREWLDLGERNAFTHYREAIEDKDILVFRSMGYFGSWRIPKESSIVGFSLYHRNCPAIVVRKEDSEARQSFSLMHELGHLLLHRTSSVDETEDYFSHEVKERAANRFAGLVLVPDHFLDEIYDTERPDTVQQFTKWLEPQCTQWGVSCEVILRRLLEVGRLDQKDYRAYREWWAQRPPMKRSRASRQYRNREPLHIFGKPYVETVYDAFHAQRISLSKTSSYLDNLKIKDVHRLEEHLAGV